MHNEWAHGHLCRLFVLVLPGLDTFIIRPPSVRVALSNKSAAYRYMEVRRFRKYPSFVWPQPLRTLGLQLFAVPLISRSPETRYQLSYASAPLFSALVYWPLCKVNVCFHLCGSDQVTHASGFVRLLTFFQLGSINARTYASIQPMILVCSPRTWLVDSK